MNTTRAAQTASSAKKDRAGQHPKLRSRFSKAYISAALTVFIMHSVFALPVFGASPEIIAINGPSVLATNGVGFWQVTFQDVDRDVTTAELYVVDGRFSFTSQPVAATTSTESMAGITLRCTPYDQEITLALNLLDGAGEKSDSVGIKFTCGQPPLYNFGSEQESPQPVSQSIPLNVFILDDGQNSIAQGAEFAVNSAAIGKAREYVQTALEAEIMTSLTGIWDQCSVGFELTGAWVVNPVQFKISGKALNEQLFSQVTGSSAIRYGRATGDLLRQATFELVKQVSEQNPRAAQAFNVIFTGTRIVADWNGSEAEVEGFSERSYPNYALIRWGAMLPGTPSKQMISTLAHELGHNLSLAHPGEDGLRDTAADTMNLMKGSGVTPQPRANLLTSQCDQAKESLTQFVATTATAVTSDPVPAPQEEEEHHDEEANPEVRWLTLCSEGTCTGNAGLGVTAEGFQDLESFSFASFEYAQDGINFKQISIDRNYQDGFSAIWDTTKLTNGTYTVRVIVTDAQGIKASVQSQVTIKN